jgi:uncharacterized RDD family membrane protein YckC
VSGTGDRREGDDLDEAARRMGLESGSPGGERAVTSGDPLWAGRPADPAPVADRDPDAGGGGWLPPTDARPDPGTYAPWPGHEPGPAMPAARTTDAEYMQRVGAAVVDFFVRLAIVLAFTLLGAIAYAGGQSVGEVGIIVGLVIGAALASFVYAPYMIVKTGGQTLGHKATSTRIVMEDGSRLSGGRAFVREVLVKNLLFEGAGGFLFAVPTIVNYVWPLFDDRNQALHDKLCATRVVEA